VDGKSGRVIIIRFSTLVLNICRISAALISVIISENNSFTTVIFIRLNWTVIGDMVQLNWQSGMFVIIFYKRVTNFA